MPATPAFQVLAVCDVDRVRREDAKRCVEETYANRGNSGVYRGCAADNDYRDLLARSDIDAVVIATPDHWHTLQSIDAAKAGKDIYCEKPVSVTLREGRELVEAVRRYGRVFQTGTQYRSIPIIRTVCEFVRTGGLGKIRSVFTLWQNPYVPVDAYLPPEPVPDGLDWHLWVGPAPWQPHNRQFHRNPVPGVVPWAFAEAFGVVSSTWFHSHAADVIQYALGMEKTGPVEIIHPASGQFPTLTCRYSNGVLLHHVDNWGQVKQLYKAVPLSARLEGNFGGVFVGERVVDLDDGRGTDRGPAADSLRRNEAQQPRNEFRQWASRQLARLHSAPGPASRIRGTGPPRGLAWSLGDRRLPAGPLACVGLGQGGVPRRRRRKPPPRPSQTGAVARLNGVSGAVPGADLSGPPCAKAVPGLGAPYVPCISYEPKPRERLTPPRHVTSARSLR